MATAVAGQEGNVEARGGLGDSNGIARLSPRLFVHVLKVQLHGQLKNSVKYRTSFHKNCSTC